MEEKLHFIGIGGIGMSAIARIMLGQGFTISGSDVAESRLTAELAAAGADIHYGHCAANLPPDCQAVVYSSAIKPDNAEMREAARRGLPVYKRAEMLAYLMSQRLGIGVAGAHGKTTTSAMIATMLEAAEEDPTVVIGGMLPMINGNAKAGNGRVLVAEADESDGTFLLLKPKIAVVTNIEADHLDYYHDLEHIVAAFTQYLNQLPPDGLGVVCYDCPIARDLAMRLPGRFISYALEAEADYTVKNIVHLPHAYGGGTVADVFYHGRLLGRLQLKVCGTHNICNALAAVAVGRALGLSFEQCAAGLERFTGTGRRFELLGQFGGLRVVDDYAHHPTEIRATIASARSQGVKKLYVVFQPHRYSRTQAMYREFADSLMDGDRVLLLELYPAFEQPIYGVSAKLVADAMQAQGHTQVGYAPDIAAALAMLEEQLADEDMLLILGAGNVRMLGEQYVAKRKGEQA